MRHALLATLALVALSCTSNQVSVQSGGNAPDDAAAAHTASASHATHAAHGSKADTSSAASHQQGMLRPDQMQWKDGPSSLPAGAKFVVLEGDPAREGYFAMRLQLPHGYKIPPHYHPNVERVTVISGTFHMGSGEQFNKDTAEALPAGSYFFMPPGMRHYAWAESPTVVQVTTLGPWAITYVNPSDDPRPSKK